MENVITRFGKCIPTVRSFSSQIDYFSSVTDMKLRQLIHTRSVKLNKHYTQLRFFCVTETCS
jgi:hypothetical protein